MTDKSIKKVLLLGSGALKIGEAGEFDYSGSQALKALKEEGVYTVLINPNIATVQTTENCCHQIYFCPSSYFVEKVIERKNPTACCSLLVGGRVELRCEAVRKRGVGKIQPKGVGNPVNPSSTRKTGTVRWNGWTN